MLSGFGIFGVEIRGFKIEDPEYLIPALVAITSTFATQKPRANAEECFGASTRFPSVSFIFIVFGFGSHRN